MYTIQLRPRSRGSLRNRFRALSAITAIVMLVTGCVTPQPLTPGSTPDFLGPHDFDGQYRPRQHDAMIGGEAEYGHIVFTNIARSVVQQALPSGYELADNTSTTVGLQDQHPVLLW